MHHEPLDIYRDPSRESLEAERDGWTSDEAGQGVGAPVCSSAERIRDFLRNGVMIAISRGRR